MPFILQSVFRQVVAVDAPDKEKTELFAAVFVTVCLTLGHQSVRRPPVGVIPGDWILDNLAIHEHVP